jgi:hypothetical protein
MSTQFLIDSIVRQVTVLIAELATAGGLRAPVAQLANQVFVQLATELEAQGVSRKVSADMFGLALRTYVRKVQRLTEARSQAGVTLWQAVLDFVTRDQLVPRERVLERFAREDRAQLTSVLHDLVQSGLLFTTRGAGKLVYRAATEGELGALSRLASDEGLDALAWVLAYRDGPLGEAELAERLSRSTDELRPCLERLLADGRIERGADGRLGTSRFVLPLGAAAGWEAAVFDHLQAVVHTIRQRLRRETARDAESADFDPAQVGGSTYSFDVWPGHPLEAEVLSQLARLRRELGDLRERVDAHNQASGVPADYRQVITYVGQCRLDREAIDGDEDEESERGA